MKRGRLSEEQIAGVVKATRHAGRQSQPQTTGIHATAARLSNRHQENRSGRCLLWPRRRSCRSRCLIACTLDSRENDWP
jgi:hypothetical protein